MTQSKRSRAEQKEQTRLDLARATRELIADRGYQATTIEDIAERAGVSPRTFFRHFPTKEAALFVRAEEMADHLSALLDQRPSDEPVWVSVQAGMVQTASAMQAEAHWMIHIAAMSESVPAIREQLEFRVGLLIRHTVQSWAERRLGVPSVVDPRPGVLAGLVAACADTARQRWIAHAGRLDLGELTRESLDAVTDLVQA